MSFLRLLPLSQFEGNLCSDEWSSGSFGTSKASGRGGEMRLSKMRPKKASSNLIYKAGSVTLHRGVVRTTFNWTKAPRRSPDLLEMTVGGNGSAPAPTPGTPRGRTTESVLDSIRRGLSHYRNLPKTSRITRPLDNSQRGAPGHFTRL